MSAQAPDLTKRRVIFAICDAYESGVGHGLQKDGHKSGAIWGDPGCGMAYEIGYELGEERADEKPAPPAAPELPPLPSPWGTMYGRRDGCREMDGFTADQMRGFAIDYAMQLGRAALASQPVVALPAEQAVELPPLRLPKLPHELYECYPSMSAQNHEAMVKDYARAAYAMGRASAVRDYVSLNDAALAARQAPQEPTDFLMPEDAWNEYATRSGLLNEHGVAPQPATTQSAYFAYMAAWNRLHKAFTDYIALRFIPRLDYDLLKLTLEQTQERLRQADEFIARQAPAVAAPKLPSDTEIYAEMQRRDANWNAYQASRGQAVNLAIRVALDLAARQVVAPDVVRDARDAARDVLAERKRQTEVEGWTPEHDDEHGNGAMAEAAACYIGGSMYWSGFDTKQRWPWAVSWWKPKDPRRNLVRAGALILAEIERIDRAAIAQEQAK